MRALRTRDQVNDAIARIGAIDRRLDEIEAAKGRAVAAAAKPHEEAAKPLAEERAGLFDQVKAWCEERRAELCARGDKFHDFPAGRVRWKKLPDVLEIAKELAGKILDKLKKIDPDRFVRVKEEIDQRALLKAPDIVKRLARSPGGIRIVDDRETFAVEPVDADLVEGADRKAA